MAKPDYLNPVGPQVESPYQITQTELLSSQAVPLQIGSRWLEISGVKMHPARNVHIVNHGLRQDATFERVEISGELHEKVPELRIIQENGGVSTYGLDQIGHNVKLPWSVRIYPHPSNSRYPLRRFSVIQFPEQDSYIKVTSEQSSPQDLLMVIDEDGNCMVRSLTPEEADLLAERDRKMAEQSRGTKDNHQIWNYRGEKMRMLQRERNKLQTGNKGKDHGRKQSLMAAIDSEMALISTMSNDELNRPRKRRFRDRDYEDSF
ncbi:hypothetical protein HYT02_00480 [Candidatus Gottesmanbacteria bacterium]|nr:hypothetical protein [Candidatus Gottesmanbacteria bacterium]